MADSEEQKAGLYVVATPIGHMADLSPRAAQVLCSVDLIAAEDTRTSRLLLDRIGSRVKTVALHSHNERDAAPALLARIRDGGRVALISDAGTPAISDPGARVVEAALHEGLRVVPIPGASAITALTSVAGLRHGRFRFEGFLPPSGGERQRRLDRVAAGDEDTVLFEAPHRIRELALQLQQRLESGREVVVGRELTKLFEEVARMPVAELPAWLDANPYRSRGEFALVVLARQTGQQRHAGAQGHGNGNGNGDGRAEGRVSRHVADADADANAYAAGDPDADADAVAVAVALSRSGSDALPQSQSQSQSQSHGDGAHDATVSVIGVRAMRVLAEQMPPRQAARLAARISGDRANDLYRFRPGAAARS